MPVWRSGVVEELRMWCSQGVTSVVVRHRAAIGLAGLEPLYFFVPKAIKNMAFSIEIFSEPNFCMYINKDVKKQSLF